MIKFTNRYGKSCRYKFGDKVIDKTDPEKSIYVVLNARWVGSKSHGFWDLVLKDSDENEFTRFLSGTGFKKVGSIYD